MSDNRAYQDARKHKEPKMMVNVPIDHTTSRLSKAAKHFRFCTDEEGNIWAMPVVGYRFNAATGEMEESLPVPSLMDINTDCGVVVQQQWYEVAHLYNVAILGIAARITVADETVEIRVTIDGLEWASAGVALAFAGNACTSITGHRMTGGTTGLLNSAAAASADILATAQLEYFLKGHDVLIEMRKTTAGGASHIIGYVPYHQY